MGPRHRPGRNILLVEADGTQPGQLLQAVDYAREAPGVSVVSMSWGSGEGGVSAATLQSLDSHFTTPAGHAGVTFVASSGDTSSPSWPAVSPNVVGVGGTTLSLQDGGTMRARRPGRIPGRRQQRLRHAVLSAGRRRLRPEPGRG